MDPSGNLASTDDVASDEESNTDSLSFAGVWLSKLSNDTVTGPNIVSISVFDEETINGDDDLSISSPTIPIQINNAPILNLSVFDDTYIEGDDTNSVNSDESMPFHTQVLCIDTFNSGDSTSISDTIINLDHVVDPYLRCLVDL